MRLGRMCRSGSLSCLSGFHLIHCKLPYVAACSIIVIAYDLSKSQQ